MRRESAERVARGISRQKIDTWILDVLGQRSSMEIRELLTLLQLLYVYLHGYDDLAKHQLGKNKEIEEQDTIQYNTRTAHSGAGRRETGAEKKYPDRRENRSLASLLEEKNPLAQARIDHLLGTAMQATDDQEILAYKSAATKTCMSYNGPVARQIPRHVYEIPYIGADAIERLLEIRQRELTEVQQRLAALAEEADCIDFS